MKQAKMANRKKGETATVARNHSVTGGPVNGYKVIDIGGDVVATHENMWDAINQRKRLDAGGFS